MVSERDIQEELPVSYAPPATKDFSLDTLTTAPTILPVKKLPHLLFLIGFFAMSLLPASAVISQGTLNWRGNLGYSAVIEFSYDYSVPIIDSSYVLERGDYIHRTAGLLNLSSRIYDPSGNLLDYNTQVTNGWVDYGALSFSFNPGARCFVPGSYIDIGRDSDSGGAYIFHGTFSPSGKAAFSIWQDNRDYKFIDGGGHDSLFVNGVRVPDGGTTGALMLMALASFGILSRFNRKAA